MSQSQTQSQTQTPPLIPTLFGQVPARPQTDSLTGRITRIVWRDPAGTSRVIAVCVPPDLSRPRKSDEFSVIGDIEDAAEGQVYEFEGRLGFNEKYNSRQLQLYTYRTVLPGDERGIRMYLAQTAKWVGLAVADALVEAFGKETLDVIKTDPGRVAERISGITLERATEMQASLLRNETREKATIEVAQLLGGVLPASVTRKATQRWGATAAGKIRKNPYILTELPGVGFASADTIYRALGLDANSLRRHVAAVEYVATEIHYSQGDTVIYEAALLAEMQRRIGTLHPKAVAGTARLRRIVRRGGSNVLDRLWSIPAIARAETELAAKLLSLLHGAGAESVPGAAPRRQPVVNLDGLADDQVAAARMFERFNVMILTGPPGTGKTYLTARLIVALGTDADIGLCAPTGKAAKQMSTALSGAGVSRVAQTIHRLLAPQMDPETGEFSFGHDAENPLPYATIVADEWSMVDIRLAHSLLSAVRNGTRVLIVGDRYQLPSIGPGSVLRDLIAAGLPSFELTQIKRNAGRIVRACHAIKDGRMPEPSERLDLAAGENWRHIEVGDADDVLDFIDALYREYLPVLGAADQFWGTQCLAPLNENGSLSCKGLNALLQPILNPNRTPVDKLDFTVGDKVVRLRNALVKEASRADRERLTADSDGTENSDLDDDIVDVVDAVNTASTGKPNQVAVVNGDIGIVREITDREIIVQFSLPERWVSLSRREPHHLRLAYCMTCHKLQGSEAPIIVMPLHRQFANSPILTREWMYTAFSRAKTALITVGQLGVLGQVIARRGIDRRKTLLRELVQGGLR